ncbi:MAG TPA: hypothetical protein VFW33_19125 [Gemmataceae bacterium]|nr:hypothetical protein [Gemmataceae bacterium]
MAAQYYIAEGVRRSVAAREAGLKVIRAILHEPGQPDRVVYVAPDQLHSPKRSISASDPRYQRAAHGMATPASRSAMPPIEIEPIGAAGQTGSVPLKDVQLDP